MNQSPMGGGGEPAAGEVITSHSSPARMLLLKSAEYLTSLHENIRQDLSDFDAESTQDYQEYLERA